MVMLAVVINYVFKWRRYPVGLSVGVEATLGSEAGDNTSHEHILSALRQIDLFVDVAEDDLVKIIHAVNAGQAQSHQSNSDNGIMTGTAPVVPLRSEQDEKAQLSVFDLPKSGTIPNATKEEALVEMR
ncbi:hypothetical protein GCM10007047_22410 [Cerasicoccus arenae]|uniref:Uncharacterized protein n=2 Tax=Cerasicoccus arenae TaxID=424488 RepID=A0A8J3DI42_9BACT|nr:hypothetical protein GCM10007047_22410 [Cerasicoccus arenae]